MVGFVVRPAILVALAIGLFIVGHFGGQSARKSTRKKQVVMALDNMDHTIAAWESEFIKSSDVDRLATLISKPWPVHGPTLEELPNRQRDFEDIFNITAGLIDAAQLTLLHAGLNGSNYDNDRSVLKHLGAATSLQHNRLKAALPLAYGKVAGVTNNDGSTVPPADVLIIKVDERPFGMHLRRGSIRVEEVFPGFPAERLGVVPGCEIHSISGKDVTAGTWLETFQETALPFEMRLNCNKQLPSAVAGQGPLSKDEHRYRVMVVKRPFGMNIEVNKLPRVTEVLAGYPAEAAGVKRGYVLTEVNDVKVNKDTWFDAFQSTAMPFTLTFDTNVPISEGNLFFGANATSASAPDADVAPRDWKLALPDADFEDFRCDVIQLPFGMEMRSVPGDWPRVVKPTPGMPADKAGVRAGDVLIEVNGLPVDSARWFGAFQQAAPPFGLKFRRPLLSQQQREQQTPPATS